MEVLENTFKIILDKAPTVGLVIITVWGCWLLWLKFGKCFECEVKKDLEFYKERFNESEEIKNMSTCLRESNVAFEKLNKKIDDKIKEDREFFERLIQKDDKQNEVLSKISTQLDMQTQLLMSIINKK